MSESRMEALTSLLEVLGAVLIAVGFFLFWPPAGFVVTGAGLIGAGWLLAPTPQRRRR